MPYEIGPYDSAHLYLQWGGKLPGNESWSCGVRMQSESGTMLITDSMMASAVAAVQTFHTAPTSFIHPFAKLSFVKWNQVGVDGKYVFQTTRETILPDVAGGGPSAPIYPNQITIVTSLTTGFTRGPAHRGRFYIPMPAIAVDQNGAILPDRAADVGLSVDTLLAGLNAISADLKVAVFSRKKLAPGHRLVTGNEVGRILDTQRRRRRSLIENYQ